MFNLSNGFDFYNQVIESIDEPDAMIHTPRLSLRQWQVFAAIADTGSTRAAGEAMGLSQSATSAALTELERLLGTPLFDRHGRQLQLNGEGRQLLPRARALLDTARQMEGQVGDPGSAPAVLRLGASTTIANYALASLLRAHWGGWYADHDEPWTSRVRIANTARICADVAGFVLDLGLIEGPCNDVQLRVLPWRSDEMVLVAAPALARRMRARVGAPVPLATLRRQVWLLREPGSGTRAETDRHLLPRLGRFGRSLELGNSEAIKSAAAQGLGVACLSRYVVADGLASGQLVCLPTALPPLRRQWSMVLHRDKWVTPALQQLMDRWLVAEPLAPDQPSGSSAGRAQPAGRRPREGCAPDMAEPE